MAAPLETKSDCTRCAALCCIAYPSDDMPGFAASKAGGEPCPKLASDGMCTIYDRRTEEGFSGCIRYECFGAGQHVVQQLFDGRDWRDDAGLLGPMIDAFLAMRPVSDAAFLVRTALTANPPAEARAKLADLEIELAQLAASAETLRDTRRLGRIEQDIRRIYATLDRGRLQRI